MKVKSESEAAQSSLTLCDHMDCSLPGSSVRGIFQARALEWGAIAFSRGTQSWKQSPELVLEHLSWEGGTGLVGKEGLAGNGGSHQDRVVPNTRSDVPGGK